MSQILTAETSIDLRWMSQTQSISPGNKILGTGVPGLSFYNSWSACTRIWKQSMPLNWQQQFCFFIKFFFVVVVWFLRQVLLYSPSWPWTQYVAQANLSQSSASASRVLKLQACATTSGLMKYILFQSGSLFWMPGSCCFLFLFAKLMLKNIIIP